MEFTFVSGDMAGLEQALLAAHDVRDDNPIWVVLVADKDEANKIRREIIKMARKWVLMVNVIRPLRCGDEYHLQVVFPTSAHYERMEQIRESARRWRQKQQR